MMIDTPLVCQGTEIIADINIAIIQCDRAYNLILYAVRDAAEAWTILLDCAYF